jgi:hypothetical protein
MSETIFVPSGMTKNNPAGSSARRFVKYLSSRFAATDRTIASRSPFFPHHKTMVIASFFILEWMNVP